LIFESKPKIAHGRFETGGGDFVSHQHIGHAHRMPIQSATDRNTGATLANSP
jgi:hypothetical protein